MIRCVAFDLDGVIIPSEPSFDLFEREHGISREQFRAFFGGAYREAMLGRCDLRSVLEPTLEEWGWSDGFEPFVEVWLGSCNTPDPDAVSLVRELRERDVVCCAATNQDPTRAADLDALSWLRELFPSRFFSCELRAAKPDPAYFDAIQTRLGVPTDSILFLDDKSENVDGARAVGWQATHVPRPDDLRAAVARHFEWMVG